MATLTDRIKSIFTLISGTAFSQVISISATFVLARIYLPGDFGVFGTSFAVCSICATFASLQFELTPIFPKRDAAAQVCVTYTCMILFAFSTLSWAAFELLNRFQIYTTAFPTFTFPMLIWLISLEQIAVNWFVRLKKFKIIATVAILKTGSIAIFQYLLSSFDGGLWSGYLFGFSLASVFYVSALYVPLRSSFSKISIKRFLAFIKIYKKFPLFSLPAAALSTTSAQLPILVIRSIFGDQYAGYYLMINRIINAPTMLISRNVHKIVSQEIAQCIAWKKRISHIVRYYVKLMFFLAILIGITIVAFTKFDGFTILLGENWKPVGRICLILLPAALMGFISKSVSRFAVYGKNELGLYYQVIMIVACLTSLYGSYWFVHDFYFVLKFYSLFLFAICFSQVVVIKLIAKELDAKIT